LEKNNWKTKLLNKDLWQKLDELREHMSKVTWVHVLAHSGIPENEEADGLAVAGCFLEEKAQGKSLLIKIENEQKV